MLVGAYLIHFHEPPDKASWFFLRSQGAFLPQWYFNLQPCIYPIMNQDHTDPSFIKEATAYTVGIVHNIHKVHPYIPFRELKSAALLGLAEALNKFDPAKGIKFFTFARHYIVGRIKDAIREEAVHPLGIVRANSRRKEPRLTHANIHELFYNNEDTNDFFPEALICRRTPIHDLLQKERNKIIRRILSRLPKRSRKVWMLYVLEGYTYPEIAELTNKTLSNVHQHIHKQRQWVCNMFIRALRSS